MGNVSRATENISRNYGIFSRNLGISSHGGCSSWGGAYMMVGLRARTAQYRASPLYVILKCY